MNYGVGVRIHYLFRWKGYGTLCNRRNVAKGFSGCVRSSVDHTVCQTNKEPSIAPIDAFEHSLDGFTPTSSLDPVVSPNLPRRRWPRTRAVANSPDIPKRARGRPRIVFEAAELRTVSRQRGRPRIGPEVSKLDVPEQEHERLQTKTVTTDLEEEPVSNPQAKEQSLNAAPSTTSVADPIVRQLQGRGRGSRLDRGQIISPDLCGKSVWRMIAHRYSRCLTPRIT